MDERQVRGVQRETVRQGFTGRSVERVARDGVADMGEVDAELVGAAGVQAQQNVGVIR